MSIMALVLSTLKLTQLFQSMSSTTKHSSVAAKIVEALAASPPRVRHISQNWLVTVLDRLISKILMQTVFSFLTPVSFDSL